MAKALNWTAGVHKLGGTELAHGNNLAVYGVRFTPDGKRLVTANGEGTIYIIKVDNGQILQKLDGVSKRDGKKSMCGGSFGMCSLDVCAGGPKPEDPDVIVTSSFDDSLQHFSSTGDLLRTQKMVGAEKVAISPSRQYLLLSIDIPFSKGGEARVHVVDFISGTHLCKLHGPNKVATSIGWSPDGQSVAAASHDNRAYVWKLDWLPKPESIKTKDDVRNIQQERHRLDAHDDAVVGLAWRPDLTELNGTAGPSLLATASTDGTIAMWDGANGRKKWRFHVPALTDASDDSDSDDDAASVRMREAARRRLSAHVLAWSLDGTQLVTGHLDGMMRIVSMEGSVLHAFKGHKEIVRSITVSCDGMIGSCSHDSSIVVWRPKRPARDDAKAASPAAEPDAATIAGAPTATAAAAEELAVVDVPAAATEEEICVVMGEASTGTTHNAPSPDTKPSAEVDDD